MRKTLAVMLTAAMSLSLLAGCGGSSAPQTTAAPAAPATQAAAEMSTSSSARKPKW